MPASFVESALLATLNRPMSVKVEFVTVRPFHEVALGTPAPPTLPLMPESLMFWNVVLSTVRPPRLTLNAVNAASCIKRIRCVGRRRDILDDHILERDQATGRVQRYAIRTDNVLNRAA